MLFALRSHLNTPATTASQLPPLPLAALPSPSLFRRANPVWPQHFINLRSFQTSCSHLQEPTLSKDNEDAAQFNQLTRAHGHIELVIGPMFAGKSSELLKRVAHYESQGLSVAILKSNKDDRYSASHVVTHDGDQKPCFAVPTLSAFRETAPAVYEAADVIAVDEAQFFSDLVDFCMSAADLDSKRLILAGLDGDFMRKRFGEVLDLVPLADTVTKLTATCRFCEEEAAAANGKDKKRHFPAVFSLRLAADNAQEVVGGADKYAPVCRRHYVKFSSTGQKKH